jgi:hypothetical protein
MPPRKTRKRTVAVTEKTETTRQVVITDESTEQIPAILVPAAGWDNMPRLTGHELREQRAEQLERTLDFIWDMTIDATGLPKPPDPLRDCETIAHAVNILRAGPGASRAELVHGRLV